MKSYNSSQSFASGLLIEAQQYVYDQGVSGRDQFGGLILRSNNLSYDRWRARHDGFTYHREGGGSGITTAKVNWSGFSSQANPADRQNCIDDAIRKFWNKASSLNTNLAEMYATRQMTVNMVTSTIRRLTSAYRALRRRNWRDACSHLGIKPKKPKSYGPENQWLEYQYGWKPLVQGVYDSINQPLPDPFLPCGGKSTMSSTRFYQLDVGEKRWSGSVTRSIRVRAGAKVTASASMRAAQTYGLNNPALLAWELLPYSFVVDWFIPVGNYLEAMGAAASLSLSQAYLSVTETTTSSGFVSFTPSVVAQYGYSGGGRSISRYTVFRRSSTVPFPSLPRLKNPLSLTHFANAMALMAVAFKRRS